MSEDVRRRVREDLARAKHYRALCPDTLDRVAAWAAARFPKARDATSAARRKLHQVCGAFIDEAALKRAGQRLDAATAEHRMETCRSILTCHASTAERLPSMDRLYQDIFKGIPPPATILDLGCGLHPFGIPWMQLAPGVRYEASDIDTRLVDLLARFFAGHVPGATAVARDLLVSDQAVEADLVFLMKSLPTLEQQEKGAGKAVLSRITARTLVVSFPTLTLGGRNVGMRDQYAGAWGPVMRETGWTYRELDYPTEKIFLLARP